jgi:hypothetical protein
MILFLIAALVLCYLFYRILPITVTAIVIMVGVIGYISFGEGEAASETVTNVGAGLIIAAFIADIVRRFTGLFRSRN